MVHIDSCRLTHIHIILKMNKLISFKKCLAKAYRASHSGPSHLEVLVKKRRVGFLQSQEEEGEHRTRDELNSLQCGCESRHVEAWDTLQQLLFNVLLYQGNLQWWKQQFVGPLGRRETLQSLDLSLAVIT